MEKMNSSQTIERLAQKIQERTNPEIAIEKACESLVSGFLSLRNLGFTKNEIIEHLTSEIRLS